MYFIIQCKLKSEFQFINTIKILIMAQAFIKITTFHKGGGGHLLEATVFNNSWKSSK